MSTTSGHSDARMLEDGDTNPDASLKIPVAQLAAEAAQKEETESWFSKLSLPMGVLSVAILVVNVMAVVLPMGLVMSKGARDGMTTLSDNLIQNTLTSAYQQINVALEQPRHAAEQLLIDKEVRRAIIYNPYNLASETSVFATCNHIVRHFPLVDTISVNSFPNVSGQVPSTWPQNLLPYNTTSITCSTGAEGHNYLYMDFLSANIGIMIGRQDPETGDPIGKPFVYLTTEQLAAYGSSADIDAASFFLPSPAKEPVWTTVFHPQEALGTGLTYSHLVWANSTPTSGLDRILFKSTANMYTRSLSDMLLKLKATDGTVNVIVKDDGVLMGASIKGASSNVTYAYKLHESSDPKVASIGRWVKQTFKDITSIPANWTGVAKLDLGQEWYIATRAFPLNPMIMTLFVAIPRSDFFEEIDKGNQRSTIITACLAVLVTTLGAVCLTMMIRPLGILTKTMKQITTFDFSAVKTGVLSHRSFVGEIREMESVFDTMCKAFAAAIRRNKSLQATTTASTTGVASRDPLGAGKERASAIRR